MGAASVDLAPAGWAPRPGEVAIQDDDEPSPAISTAHGPGPFGAIKPDLLAHGGRHDVRTIAAGDNLRLRVMRETGRSGVFVEAARAGPGDSERARGTSCGAALTTRAASNAAAELTGEDGPFPCQELTRRDLASLTRALAVNASRWPEAAHARFREERRGLGRTRTFRRMEATWAFWIEHTRANPDKHFTVSGFCTADYTRDLEAAGVPVYEKATRAIAALAGFARSCRERWARPAGRALVFADQSDRAGPRYGQRSPRLKVIASNGRMQIGSSSFAAAISTHSPSRSSNASRVRSVGSTSHRCRTSSRA